MEAIAKIVGVKKPALYYYFPGKQDLLYATLDEFTQQLAEGMESIYDSPSTPTEKLEKCFHYHVESLVTRRDEFTVLLAEFKYLKARRKKQIIARRDRYEGIVRRLVQDGIAAGEFRPVKANFAAMSFLAIANWMYQWYKEGRLRPNELAAHFWDLYLRGLAA